MSENEDNSVAVIEKTEAGEQDTNEQNHNNESSLDGLTSNVEAALLTADRAISAKKISEAIEHATASDVKKAIEDLNTEYETSARSFRIESVAGGYRIMTLHKFGPLLAALKKKNSRSSLSPSAMETLAIVAYRQPILRAQVESIRGAASGEMLRGLMDSHLVKIVGRAEEIGRPILYGTSKTFLEVFGLSSLKDLPEVDGQE